MAETTETQVTEKITPDSVESTPSTEGSRKTFTQAEVDSIVANRLARAAKNNPTAEELKEFREYKKSKQTEAEKFAELDANYKAAQAEIATLKNLQAVAKSECRPEFSEFVSYSVSGMDGDFETNLAAFKKKNPQFFAASTSRQQSSAPAMTNGSGAKKTTDEAMNDLIRSAWKH